MKKELKIILIGIILLSICFGVSYAFFNYTAVTNTSFIKTGNVYMRLNNKGNGDIALNYVFPETKEHARSRDDNFIEFDILGYRTIETKDINYTISLEYGSDQDGKTRILDKYLMFDLTKVTSDGDEYLVDGISYANISDTTIYNGVIDGSLEKIETFRLRYWVRDDLLISSTSSIADYSQEEWKNLFSSVKLKVYGSM